MGTVEEEKIIRRKTGVTWQNRNKSYFFFLLLLHHLPLPRKNQEMSYQHYPPPGYGSTYPPPALPPGYSSAHGHPPQYMGLGYPPPAAAADPYSYPQPQPQPQPPGYQGYFAPDQYPPPSPHPIPYQVYHCEHYDDHDDCSSFLRGCLAALCFCCVLEECF